jgi:hypothetical protein
MLAAWLLLALGAAVTFMLEGRGLTNPVLLPSACSLVLLAAGFAEEARRFRPSLAAVTTAAVCVLAIFGVVGFFILLSTGCFITKDCP